MSLARNSGFNHTLENVNVVSEVTNSLWQARFCPLYSYKFELRKKSFYLRSKTLHKWIKVVGKPSLLADGILIALYMVLDSPLPGDKSYNFITVFWKMAQRHFRVYKTSKCSSDTYVRSSLSSDFMWNIDVVGWKNWQSPLASDQVAEIIWFGPGHLLGPQLSMCVISETVYILIPNLYFFE